MKNTQKYVEGNRKKLKDQLAKGSIAVINSNDIMPSNADGVLHFRQNNDLYWLTGIQQEGSTLLLFPDHPDHSKREILFLKKVDEVFVKWHGRLLSMEEAREISGIENILWDTDFNAVFYTCAVFAENIYLNAIEHPRAINMVETRDDRFAIWCREKFRLHNYKRLAPILAKLRLVKSEYEIEQLKKACDISELGFRRILTYVKPGVKEKLIQAELIHEYMQHDGEWADYEPIIASGQNSCILHYIKNNNICRNGDILLIDAAASYRLFNADLTRAIPVNGKYSARQKKIYNAVLKVHKAIRKHVKAGQYLHDIQAFTNELLIEEMMGLKLFSLKELKTKGPAYFINKHSYHGFGHYLGLDVHDVGNPYEKLQENTVITVEPGIYIWDEATGVRIENNVLVTKKGTVDLMANIPIEADEIESLMNA